jgi:uncharacterized protein
VGRFSTTGGWRRGLPGGLTCGLLLLLAAPAAAQVPAGPLPSAEIPFGQGRLWQVERPGAEPSYVFGTFHGADPRLLDLPAGVEARLSGAWRLILELRFDRETLMRVGAAMVAPPGACLCDLVEPQLFAQVTTVGARYGLPPRALDGMRPWALISIFSMPPVELVRQKAGVLPLDQQLQASAEERGIPIYGLETVAEQVAIFDALPDADEVTLLRAAVQENAQIDDSYAIFLEAYLAGDGGSLLELTLAQARANQEAIYDVLLERLLAKRNARMVARMQEHLAVGRSFVAVGDLHLRGADGILAGLERRGYRISRLL